MTNFSELQNDLTLRFGTAITVLHGESNSVPIFSVSKEQCAAVLGYLKTGIKQPYSMLFDLFAIDERMREHGCHEREADFTIVYHLLSFDRNNDLLIKVPVSSDSLSVPTITGIWPSATWYEREAWDMFGVQFDGHQNLSRILMPPWWQGHPLRKDHPSRATESPPFRLTNERVDELLATLQFDPAHYGLTQHRNDGDYLFVNIGPHHTGTHGLFRIVCQLHGETIKNAVPDIGFHHRGAEKMAERQTWHTFIPYTDRVDYLSGVVNNLAYVLAVEKLAAITVPPRAQCIRVMLSELFRIASHLVFYGTFAQDLGAMSPVFYMFTDREKVLEIIEAVCGARMHPNWFRIGGVADDLPKGWERVVDVLLKWLPARLKEYDTLVFKNPIFKRRTKGIGAFTLEEAVEWGVTGPGLRACGCEWDMRKKRPYSGYEHYDFEIPVAQNGDCYDRASIRIEEIRQSLRIVAQCRNNMPAGDYKSDHPLASPPKKEKTMHDIETLITHFLSVSWGPVIAPGEAHSAIEATKGVNGYYAISDGKTTPYRMRIRTPSFAHLQMVPLLCKGAMLSDLIAILGAVDFVLADVDR
jgi:NADH-quinone oxidoreductase subunit C/D